MVVSSRVSPAKSATSGAKTSPVFLKPSRAISTMLWGNPASHNSQRRLAARCVAVADALTDGGQCQWRTKGQGTFGNWR